MVDVQCWNVGLDCYSVHYVQRKFNKLSVKIFLHNMQALIYVGLHVCVGIPRGLIVACPEEGLLQRDRNVGSI